MTGFLNGARIVAFKMTPSKFETFLCWFCVALSQCFALSGWSQGTGGHVAAQAHSAFSIGPIRHPREGLDAWPKITAPLTPAVERANATIAGMNQQTIETFWDCDAKADWERRITVAMLGPRFIAMTENKTLLCGNAYPYNDHAAVVLDMTTGELVDWREFIKGGEDASARSDKSIDGAISSEVVMPSLTELAIRRADPECKKALEESGALVFQLWPDAKVRVRFSRRPACSRHLRVQRRHVPRATGRATQQ
jgi:hypothetical protein